MRIMQFAGGGDIGGAKTHILSLGCQLKAENEYCLVSFRPGPFAEEARRLGLRVVTANNPWNLFSGLQVALRAVDEFQPDVIHCHGAKANMMGVLVGKRRHIPIVTTVHSDPARDYMGMPLKQFIFGNINFWALRRMDYYMAVATPMEQSLIRRGIDPQRIFIIHNGMDFSAPATPRQAPENSDIVVGIAARLTPIKNIPTLLRAFAIAQSKEPRLLLRIAGTGEDELLLKNLAQELGVAERVDFVGWVTDMGSFFAGVDINVLSSYSETFPYSLLEGACAHCPAIASAVGGIPELIQHGESGYLFQPEDVETFAGYISDMAADPALRQRLGDALFQRAKALFSLEHMRDTQLTAYQTLLRRWRRSGRQGAVICGAYGRGNAGDEAILQAIVSQMRAIDPDMPLTVLSRNQQETRLTNKTDAIYVFSVRKFIRKLRSARIFINGGGSLIQDVTSSRSLYFYLFTLWAARLCGCRIIMYGCGIGPINRCFNRHLAAKVLNRTVEVITLRDSVSQQVLVSMGVTKPQVYLAADPTVTIERSSDQRVAERFTGWGIPAEADKICFCLRPWPGFVRPEEIAEAADYAWQRYGLLPIFLAIELPRDIAANNSVAKLVHAPHHVIAQRCQVEDLIAILGSMKVVVGMRLHSLIFATAGGAPVIGLSYDVKVDSFIQDIGSCACLGLEQANATTLKAEIDRMAQAGFPRSDQTVQRLMGLERINTDNARRLLEENL